MSKQKQLVTGYIPNAGVYLGIPFSTERESLTGFISATI